MDKEEYYKRIEKINNRFKTDRVSADEEYHLVCQKNYLSTKYIEHLEQQCKKQKEVIDKAVKYIENEMPYLQETDKEYEDVNGNTYFTYKEYDGKELLDILNEASE